MKKLTLLSLLLLAGCSDSSTVPNEIVPVEKTCKVHHYDVTASKKFGDLTAIVYRWNKGETVQITAFPVDQFGAIIPTTCAYARVGGWSFPGEAVCIPSGDEHGLRVNLSCTRGGRISPTFASQDGLGQQTFIVDDDF